MRVKQEHITHPAQSFCLLHLTQPAFTNPRHRHAHLELTWIEQGEGMRFVGNHVAPFGPGDLVLVGPHLPHTWLSAREHAGQPHVVTVLQVAPELLFDARVPELAALGELARRAGCGLRVTGAAHAAATEALRRLQGARSDLQRLAILIGLLDLLNGHDADLVPLASTGARAGMPGDAMSGADPGARRIDRVVDWIDRHFDQPLTVEAAAGLVHVTGSAFSRYFRREMGKRFTEYINDVRCSEACILLAGSERPIAAVAQACGFDTLSNFNRQFRRRHGMSPGTFRRQAHALRGERRDAAACPSAQP